MLRFIRSQTSDLVNYFHASTIHDSEFAEINYDPAQRIAKIKVINYFYGIRIDMRFLNVKLFISVNEDKWGTNNSISSLTVEDSQQLLELFPKLDPKEADNCIYCLFQLFSGNEIHILSTDVELDENCYD